MAEIDEALALVASRPDRSFFVGPISDEAIAAAEQGLGVTFPDSYRKFLSALGAGNVGSEEFFGIVDESGEFQDSAIPNGIWATLSTRRETALPNDLVLVYFDGGVTYYALSTSAMNAGECPVVLWVPGLSDPDSPREEIFPSFGACFLDAVSMVFEQRV